MPFESDKQRRFMFARHPGIARRWVDEAHEEGVSPTKHKKRRKRRRKAEQMEKSMDLVDIRKAAFGVGAFRAANTAPLHREAMKQTVGRPYTPNPFTMAAMEGLARRRAAKQLRAVKKAWELPDLVEIGKKVEGDKVSRRELKGKYRPGYLTNFNPRSETEVKRNTKTRRVVRAAAPAVAGGVATGTVGAALAAALTRGKGAKSAAKRAAHEAAKGRNASRGALVGSVVGTAGGASVGRSANIQSGDVRATHRKSGKKAEGITSLSSVPYSPARYRYAKTKKKDED